MISFIVADLFTQAAKDFLCTDLFSQTVGQCEADLFSQTACYAHIMVDLFSQATSYTDHIMADLFTQAAGTRRCHYVGRMKPPFIFYKFVILGYFIQDSMATKKEYNLVSFCIFVNYYIHKP